MQIRSLIVGPLEVNTYIIYDSSSKDAMIIDPGDEPDRIEEIIKTEALSVRYIVCTHAHFDHVGAVPELKKSTEAEVLIHQDEMEIYEAARDMAAFWGYDIEPLPKPDRFLKEGDTVKIGSLSFSVMHTPGHSPGGICLYGEGVVITGDTLFAGSVGRTDFHGGSLPALKESFKRLMKLPAETVVLPGHGPKSTIKEEQENNFFIQEVQ
ncbi:MAG: MBL fold metallo-hydrolase [Nitrospirae bacterium]|nr:MAG: MBL fold metallo-hydrolase [Nitrospirota bacterium]